MERDTLPRWDDLFRFDWDNFNVSAGVRFSLGIVIGWILTWWIDGDYFIQALGYNPHIPLHSDPLKLKAYLDSKGLKVSQLDAAYPMSSPEGQHRGVGYTCRAIQFAKALDCPCVDNVHIGTVTTVAVVTVTNPPKTVGAVVTVQPVALPVTSVHLYT